MRVAIIVAILFTVACTYEPVETLVYLGAPYCAPDAGDAGEDAVAYDPTDADAALDASADVDAQPDADASLDGAPDAPLDAAPDAAPGCTPVPFAVGATLLAAADKTTTTGLSLTTTAGLPAGHTALCMVGSDNVNSVTGESYVFSAVSLGGRALRRLYEFSGASSSPAGSSTAGWWTVTADDAIASGATLATSTWSHVVVAQSVVCVDLGTLGDSRAVNERRS